MQFTSQIKFEELMNKVMSIEPFRIEHLLECSLNDSGEDVINWAQALKTFLIDLGHDENLNINKPHQVNIVFGWIKTKQTKELKEIHKKANWQLIKPVIEWNESDYNTNRNKINELKRMENRDKAQNAFLSLFIEKEEQFLKLKNVKNPTSKKKFKTFEELFFNPSNAEPCLSILKKLQIVSSDNRYIGKNKGKITAWYEQLNHSPIGTLVEKNTGSVVTNALNNKIHGLCLDGSEFRKVYVRVDQSNFSKEVKLELSQLSQDGKIGK